jgi:hypothetical protein
LECYEWRQYLTAYRLLEEATKCLQPPFDYLEGLFDRLKDIDEELAGGRREAMDDIPDIGNAPTWPEPQGISGSDGIISNVGI